MRKMKRLFSIITAAALMLPVAACGNGTSKTDNGNKSVSEDRKPLLGDDSFLTGKDVKGPDDIEGYPIENIAGAVKISEDSESFSKSKQFSDEIEKNKIADFEKSGKMYNEGLVDKWDRMVHVSTFYIIDNKVYMTYYANYQTPDEDPSKQTARFAYCTVDSPNDIVFFDLQSASDTFEGKTVTAVYDTIMMKKDDDTLFLMWTAALDGTYYRLYRTYTISTGELSDIMVNYFKVGDVTNYYSAQGIVYAFAEKGIAHKKLIGDIGIMQKLSTRVENGETWYYSGTYCGEFNCIIKSRDLITWEYVSQPDFKNLSKWENATYVIGDKVYYFVRQRDCGQGFLTAYDLVNDKWSTPVLVDDCQSRSDFFVYDNKLFLIHAPKNRTHFGILEVDTEKLENSREIITSKLKDSYFYPFTDVYGKDVYLSFTVDRKHIRLTKFNLSNYISD